MSERNDHWWHPSVRLWNTLSNAAYPVAGGIGAVLMDFPAAWAFAGLLTVLGVGSALYHWFGSPLSRYFDWFGMFAVIFGLATFAADPNGPHIHWWMVGVSAVSATLLTFVKQQVGREPVLGLGMLLVALPVLASGVTEAVVMVLVSLTLFGVGLGLQRSDMDIGDTGHGWWHVFTATGFLAMFVAISMVGVGHAT